MVPRFICSELKIIELHQTPCADLLVADHASQTNQPFGLPMIFFTFAATMSQDAARGAQHRPSNARSIVSPPLAAASASRSSSLTGSSLVTTSMHALRVASSEGLSPDGRLDSSSSSEFEPRTPRARPASGNRPQSGDLKLPPIAGAVPTPVHRVAKDTTPRGSLAGPLLSDRSPHRIVKPRSPAETPHSDRETFVCVHALFEIKFA